MGSSSSRAGGGAIAYIPGGNGRPADTLGAVRPRAGESLQAAFARAGVNTRGARILTLDADDIRQGGGFRNFRDAEVADFGGPGSRFVQSRSVGSVRAANARLGSEGRETRRAATNRRATANVNRLREQLAAATRERTRVQRQSRGNAESTRRRKLAPVNRRIANLREQLAAQGARIRE